MLQRPSNRLATSDTSLTMADSRFYGTFGSFRQCTQQVVGLDFAAKNQWLQSYILNDAGILPSTLIGITRRSAFCGL
jgi:hypothetical protein